MSLLELTMEALQENDIDHMVSVANLEGAALYKEYQDAPDLMVIDACREGEAVGIAAGLTMAGKRACLSVENFGLFESLDTLRALPCDMGIGIPIFVGFTGRESAVDVLEPFVGNMATHVVLAGEWTERVLDATGIAYGRLLIGEEEGESRKTLETAFRADAPFALLIDTFEEE
jgi:sulfopyruvate decarboxylase TPP-binding subunit